jgi:SAM-dependent methyltransferase
MTSPALSFGTAARLYDAVRPTYPADAIAWALGDSPLRVLDLGAGTGRLTGVLLAAGHEVVSVEPDAQMLEVLAAQYPSAIAMVGTAERIPLPEGAVDAIVCGQAYHWFDRETALPEAARVLVPGGTFAPIWNLRDKTVPWVAQLSAIVGSAGADMAGVEGGLEFGPWFGETEHGVFEHHTQLTPEGLVDLFRSRSYYLTATPQRRAEVEAAVRELAATDPQLAGKERFAMPYRTHVHRSRRV